MVLKIKVYKVSYPRLIRLAFSLAFVGVVPLNCDSGNHRGERHIRGGRQPARNCLYMAAFNVRKKCQHFKTYFDGLIARGKRYDVAMTACMRKLLVMLNQMVKTNTHWDPKFFGANP